MKTTFTKFTAILFGIIFCNVLIAQMTLEFNTNLGPGTTVTLPLYGTVNVMVDWGDGNNDTYSTQGYLSHTYISDGYFNVSISGSLGQFGNYGSYPNAEKLVKVTSFGDLGLTNLNGSFYGSTNLEEVPSLLPSTVNYLSYSFAFTGKETITGLNSWDVSNIINMNGMFSSAIFFNQDIGSWDVSGVAGMVGMFEHANNFNQDIGSWNVGNGIPSTNSVLRAWHSWPTFGPCEKIRKTAKNRCMPG